MPCFTGCVVPGMPDVLDAVVAAHMVATPDLPLVGWDVALTPGARQLLASAVAPGALRCTRVQPPAHFALSSAMVVVPR
jgi:hypothetical protein